MAQQVALADWLEDLATFGTPRRIHDSETAHHLAQAISYWYLVKLATAPQVQARRKQLRQTPGKPEFSEQNGTESGLRGAASD